MQMNGNPVTSQGYYNPNERQDPINYDDPNDHRNYINGPDLSALPPINNGMTYHDFEYIGYQTRSQMLRSSNRSVRQHQTIDHSPRNSMKPPHSTINRSGGPAPRRAT